MGLDMRKLKDLQSEIEDRKDGLFFKASKIGKETNVRILPPRANMDGLYFVKMKYWWIKNKPYINLETFGETDVIGEYLRERTEGLKKSDDPGLFALLNDKKMLKQSTVFMIPILLLEGEGVKEVETEDGGTKEVPMILGPKILEAGVTLRDAINAIFTSRHFQNGTEDGIADRRKGFNVSLSKIGEGLSTEYSATGWNKPMVMPKKYYEDDQMPDPIAIRDGKRKSKEYLLSVIENYLDGTPILEEDEEGGSAAPAKTVTRGKVSKPKARSSDPIADLERMQNMGDDDDDAPPVKKKAKPAPARDEEDDDEEDEVPVKKVAGKKAKPVQEEEDDDDEEEAPPAKVVKKVKPAPVQEEEEEDEDDEEEAPVKKVAGKKAKPAPVRDEEEEEDDDDEDDAPPVKKRVASPAASKLAKPGKKSDLGGLSDD